MERERRQPHWRGVSIPDRRLTAVLLLIAAFAIVGGASTMARPTPGYGDLIDSYCIGQGRLRVAAHQSHCAMCHQAGTFDSLPAHRVQPNWSEFERSRSSGDFSFFCPGSSVVPSPTPPGTAAGQAPSTGAVATPEPHAMPMARPPSVASSATDRSPAAPAEVELRLSRFRDALGIGQPESASWTAFAEAVRSAAIADRRSFADQASPGERLDALTLMRQQERRLSARIAALRYVATAFTRLLPELDDRQRKTANEQISLVLEVL